MCTAVPPPSPPRPPKYVPKDPPTPSKPTVHGPYTAKTLQLFRDNHGGGVQYFVDGVLNRRAMYRFAVQQPKKNPLRVWQEGMRISRSHFLNNDEEHAAVVLEVLCATPKHPRIPKPPPQPSIAGAAVPHYSHWLPPQSGRAPPRSLARCSSGEPLSQPATAEAPAWVIAPCARPPAATPDLGETFQFPALRQRPRKWTYTVFFNTTSRSGRTETSALLPDGT